MLVTPPTGTVLVGRTLALAGAARDAAGNPLVGRALAWTSSADGLARVDAVGTVTITATSEGRSGFVDFFIEGSNSHNALFRASAVAPRLPGAPDDIPITNSQRVRRTFTTAGEYPVVCTVHPGTTSRVIVRQQAPRSVSAALERRGTTMRAEEI